MANLWGQFLTINAPLAPICSLDVQYGIMDGGLENNSERDSNIAAISPTGDSNEVNPVTTVMPTEAPNESITWTASEFVAHKKGLLWYVLVIGVAIFVAGLIWLLTRDITSTSVILVAALVLIIYGAKRPRELKYRVDREGIHIGDKDYPYDRFHSFSTVHQGAFSSLILYPMKRFAQLSSAYYDPLDEQKIISIISSYLPQEERRRDLVDDLMWKIRF